MENDAAQSRNGPPINAVNTLTLCTIISIVVVVGTLYLTGRITPMLP